MAFASPRPQLLHPHWICLNGAYFYQGEFDLKSAKDHVIVHFDAVDYIADLLDASGRQTLTVYAFESGRRSIDRSAFQRLKNSELSVYSFKLSENQHCLPL